jgi:hypothetical protein
MPEAKQQQFLGNNEEKRLVDNRAVWERPELRRLPASEAQGGGTVTPSDHGAHKS